MLFNRLHRSKQGFTLIELMVTVIIIGIIAGLAIPRFMQASTKTKTAEAQTILKQLFVMQRAYQQEYDTYWGNGMTADKDNAKNFAKLSVDLAPSARYTYSITADQTSFTCTATANIDDDPTVDTWTIDSSGQLQNTINDTSL
jgi:type IV pilus assembly protein PilE